MSTVLTQESYADRNMRWTHVAVSYRQECEPTLQQFAPAAFCGHRDCQSYFRNSASLRLIEGDLARRACASVFGCQSIETKFVLTPKPNRM